VSAQALKGAELVRISPSQIKTWHDLCPRRWYYERHRKRSQNEAAAAGERMHTVLERWLEYGTPPDLGTDAGRTAVAGLGLIPGPHVAQVELKFEHEHQGVTYNGRIDFAAGYEPGRFVLVGDHKSIGDIRRAKSIEDLRDDPQWVIYGHWAAEHYEVETVGGRWVYYQRTTKSRPRGRAAKVEFSASRSELRGRFQELHERRSLPIVQARTSGELPPRNLKSCHLFPSRDPATSGCPYKRECHATLDPAERLHATIFG